MQDPGITRFVAESVRRRPSHGLSRLPHCCSFQKASPKRDHCHRWQFLTAFTFFCLVHGGDGPVSSGAKRKCLNLANEMGAVSLYRVSSSSFSEMRRDAVTPRLPRGKGWPRGSLSPLLPATRHCHSRDENRLVGWTAAKGMVWEAGGESGSPGFGALPCLLLAACLGAHQVSRL